MNHKVHLIGGPSDGQDYVLSNLLDPFRVLQPTTVGLESSNDDIGVYRIRYEHGVPAMRGDSVVYEYVYSEVRP